MGKAKLAICIPTYNRESYLRELLASIVLQADPEMVQIAVSDNASTDQTEQLVNEVREKFPNIAYHKWPNNMGADKNYLKAVEIADGEYCWLMGSDDYVPEGAVGRILSLLGDEDIYLFGRTEASLRLERMRNCYWLDESEPSQKFRFSSRSEIIRYFNACRRLGGLFSYLSSIVVKKSSWERINFDEIFIGTLYSHAFILLAIVQSQATLSYIKEPLIISRAGNDSFLTDWVRRGLIDLKGYHQLGTRLIPDMEVRRAFWAVMRHEHAPINAIKSLAASGWKDWAEYKKFAHGIYLVPRWVTFVAEVAYPFSRLAYRIKRLYKKHVHR